MQSGILSFGNLGGGNFLKLAGTALLTAGLLAAPCLAQQGEQKTFASPEEASKALYTAAQGNDEKALLELLGPEGKQIVSSGNEAEEGSTTPL